MHMETRGCSSMLFLGQWTSGICLSLPPKYWVTRTLHQVGPFTQVPRMIKLSHFTDWHISLAFIMIFLNKRYYVKSYCVAEYDVGDKNVSLFPWCYLVQITTRKLNIKCFHHSLKCLDDSLPFIQNYWMFLIFKIFYSLQQYKKPTKIPMNYSLTEMT